MGAACGRGGVEWDGLRGGVELQGLRGGVELQGLRGGGVEEWVRCCRSRSSATDTTLSPILSKSVRLGFVSVLKMSNSDTVAPGDIVFCKQR